MLSTHKQNAFVFKCMASISISVCVLPVVFAGRGHCSGRCSGAPALCFCSAVGSPGFSAPPLQYTHIPHSLYDSAALLKHTHREHMLIDQLCIIRSSMDCHQTNTDGVRTRNKIYSCAFLLTVYDDTLMELFAFTEDK